MFLVFLFVFKDSIYASMRDVISEYFSDFSVFHHCKHLIYYIDQLKFKKKGTCMIIKTNA